MNYIIETVYPKTTAGRLCVCCRSIIPKEKKCFEIHFANLRFTLCFNCFKSHIVKLLDKEYYTDKLLNEVIANEI